MLALFLLSEVEHNFGKFLGGTAADKFPFGFTVFPKIDSTELVVERERERERGGVGVRR